MKLGLVIPTYNEKENIQKLIAGLTENFARHKIDAEIIVVDDNSPDGTGQVVNNLKWKYPNLQTVHRQGKLGLSSAVIAGFQVSRAEILGVMDADLSHPLEKIPEMLKTLQNQNADLVIGSRYVRGGHILGWNFHRKTMSRGATLLGRFFVNAKDPMSGFFLFKRELVVGKDINPKGFKILLEVLIKNPQARVVEVPITFTNRKAGKSKAGTKEIIYYLRNLAGYITYKKDLIREFIKFAVVGLVGTFINVGILYVLTERAHFYYIVSAIIAFLVAVTSNFIFNKIWTFGGKISTATKKEYSSFFLVSLVALAVNLFFLYIFTEFLHVYYIISQVIAIGLALVINFAGNKIWTFRKSV